MRAPGPGSNKVAIVTRRFRIAFSFAGEKRGFVSQVAALLGERFGREAILYDKFHEAEFARHDLGIYLPKLYREQSDLVVAVLCPDYDKKQWTGWEWMAIYAQLTKREGERIMLTRFDLAHVDGLFDAAAFVELDERTPQQTAGLILERLALNEGRPRDYYSRRAPLAAGEGPSAPVWPDAQAEALFAATLCAQLEPALRMRAAAELLAFLKRQTRLEGDALVRAARFLIEHRLLTAEAPHCVLRADGSARLPRGAKEHDVASLLGAEMGRAAMAAPFASPTVKLQKPELFLRRALERADDWHNYFVAVAALQPGEHQTLCKVEVRHGAIAAHSLLAGMMSHFHEDWKPVISGYEWATHAAHATDLERIKASQWICWLVWGPSIPVCSCSHWGEQFAYQYGYGDENNSLPAVVAGADGAEELARQLGGSDARPATGVVDLVGHLAWGPFAFAKGGGFAKAQSRLVRGGSRTGAGEHLSEGLFIKVCEIEPRVVPASKPAYFTAYLWLMFWIGRAAAGPGGPLRLDGGALPDAPVADGERKRLRKLRLWEDLLPVFLHTNILDPVVLRLQKGVLIENALCLLRCIRDDDEKLRRADPAKSALEFHLVCASDWSGCGHPIRFPPPPQESLIEMLRARLAREPAGEDGVARALKLPATDAQAVDGPAPAFRALLSACHLPERVEDYYCYLQHQTEEREGSS